MQLNLKAGENYCQNTNARRRRGVEGYQMRLRSRASDRRRRLGRGLRDLAALVLINGVNLFRFRC